VDQLAITTPHGREASGSFASAVNDLPAERLTCIKCGREQVADERGWRAYLTVDDADDEEPVEAVVLCPDCAAREFGAAAGHLPSAGWQARPRSSQ
jgi:hypothetical protein